MKHISEILKDVWQKQEAESLRALAEGDYAEFDDIEEALAWLESDEDEDRGLPLGWEGVEVVEP